MLLADGPARDPVHSLLADPVHSLLVKCVLLPVTTTKSYQSTVPSKAEIGPYAY